MSDYKKLVEALRCVEHEKLACPDCTERDCYANSGRGLWCRVPLLLEDAAAAIEALQAEVGQWKAAVKGQEDGIKVLQTEVKRLQEAENSVERWKDMYLTKHEPKRGEWKVDMSHFSPHIVCSVCGVEIPCVAGWCMDAHMNYCPNCGAKMEVKE